MNDKVPSQFELDMDFRDTVALEAFHLLYKESGIRHPVTLAELSYTYASEMMKARSKPATPIQ